MTFNYIWKWGTWTLSSGRKIYLCEFLGLSIVSGNTVSGRTSGSMTLINNGGRLSEFLIKSDINIWQGHIFFTKVSYIHRYYTIGPHRAYNRIMPPTMIWFPAYLWPGTLLSYGITLSQGDEILAGSILYHDFKGENLFGSQYSSFS